MAGIGSDEGLATFVAREYPRLVGALTVHCGDRALAEDFAQEALARACDRWDRVGAMEVPAGWVYRTAMNLASSWFRRRQAELRANRRHGVPDGVIEHDAADALAVRGAIRGLPPKQRSVLACRYYLGMSVAETADVMRCSDAAVRQHTSRAVKALRARFAAAPAGGDQRHG